jgi:hypothetical protein
MASRSALCVLCVQDPTPNSFGWSLVRAYAPKVLPGWGAELRYNTARALKEAQDLVTWCRQHHSNKLVKRRLDRTLCDDPSQHGKHLGTLRFLKLSASGKTADEYPEAFGVLDEAFGAKAWRPIRSKYSPGSD